MVTEEGRLAPARVPGAEDVYAEELEQRDAHRDGSPEDEATDHDRQILDAPHEERYDKGKQRVLPELEEAHQMVVEEGVVQRRRPKCGECEPHEQGAAGNPEESSRLESSDSESRGRESCGNDDHENGRIREPDVDRSGAHVDRELGLIALVEKQERQRCSENERPESVAVEEVADLGSHERALERRGRHRATIEATIAGRSLRRVRSLH